MNNEDVFKARVKEMIDGLRLSVTDQRKQLDAIVKDAVKISIKCIDNINEALMKMELKGAEMREIKFRGTAKETNEFVYGYYYHRAYDDKHIIKDVLTGSKTEIYPETLGQYTGFTDKWYKEIYEGDKVRDKYGNIYEVVFENGRFMCLVSTVYLSDNPRLLDDLVANIYNDVKVIGTIHDGKYGISEEDKKLLEANIEKLENINEDIFNRSLSYKSEVLEQGYKGIAIAIEKLKELLRR